MAWGKRILVSSQLQLMSTDYLRIVENRLGTRRRVQEGLDRIPTSSYLRSNKCRRDLDGQEQRVGQSTDFSNSRIGQGRSILRRRVDSSHRIHHRSSPRL